MSAFAKAVGFVLDIETDKIVTDTGGLTKYGISQRAYPDLDIANLTEVEASAIYRRDYWDACHCDELPEALAVLMFDCAVNQGVPTAVRLIQTSLKVSADGVLGPATLAAYANAMTSTTADFIYQRMNRYLQSANFATYGAGWLRRVAQCAVAAFTP